jgi:hypothetical protein
VQGLSVLSEANNKACKSSSDHRSLLVIHNLWNRYHGCFAQDARWVQILICSCRLVHQVDGSYVSSEHHTRCSSQVPVEFHIQIWHTQVSPYRERDSVQMSKICKMLFRLSHQSPSIIGSTSSDERASRASKQTHSTWDENKDVSRSGREREELAQGAAINARGTLN